MKQRLQQTQGGATLLEVLAFLGVASLIMIGAVSMYKSAQSLAEANRIMAQINSFRSSVKMLYTNQGGFTSSTNINRVLVAAGALPDNMRILPNNRILTGSGPSYMPTYVIVSTNASSASIMYYQVSTDVCVKAATMTGKSWANLAVNYGPPYAGGVMTTAMATAACTWGEENHLWWQFRN